MRSGFTCFLALTLVLPVAMLPATAPGQPADPAPSIVLPVPANLIQPKYPPALVRQRTSGYLLMQFRLDDEGKPRDPRVLMEEPKGAFQRAVKQTLSRLRFSVPPDWAARHPDRLLDFGYVFVVDKCVGEGLFDNLFPGIDTNMVVSVWLDRKKEEACKGVNGPRP